MCDKKLIRLYTTDNEWEYYAQKEGDHHFSSFLSDLQESTGTLPDELLLESSLAEVIEAEWDNYLSIYNSNRIVTAILDAYRASKQASLPYNSMRGLSSLHASLTTLILQHANIVKYDQVHRIMRVVNAFEGWELYVAVYNSASKDDVLAHLLAMCRHLVNLNVFPQDISNMQESHPPYASARGMMRECAVTDFIRDLLPEKRGDVLDTAIRGILHNAFVATRHMVYSCISIYSFAWNYLEDVILALNDGVLPAGSDMLINAARVLTGKGDASLPSPSLGVRTEKDKNRITHLILPIADTREISQVYESILASTPDTVNPVEIGLGALVGIRVSVSTYSYLEVLYYTHKMVQEGIEEKYQQLSRENVVAYARMLLTVVGHKSGKRLAQIMSVYVKNSENDETLARTFIDSINGVQEGAFAHPAFSVYL